MADDVLVLGGIAFTGFSPPQAMPFGGRQAMVVHKLPGGSRVIDLLGPDEEQIHWTGFFYGNDAYSNAMALDAMRASGQLQVLSFGGQSRLVIIEEFIPRIRRLPVWVEYGISLTVYQNPQLGVLGGIVSAIDSLVTSDLSIAAGIP